MDESNADSNCEILLMSQPLPCNLLAAARPLKNESFKKTDLDLNTSSYCKSSQISQPLPCNLTATSRPLVNEIKYFKKTDLDDSHSDRYCETSHISQPLPCNLTAKSRPLVNEIKSFKKRNLDDLKINSHCEISQIPQTLSCNLADTPRPIVNQIKSFKKTDLDDFNTDSYCETSVMSQPLPCNLIAKSRPLINEIKYFKKTDLDDFNTNSCCKTSQISQPLPCNLTATSRPLVDEIKSFNRTDVDDFNTNSYCETSQTSQPLPCNLTATSRPLVDEIKSFNRTDVDDFITDSDCKRYIQPRTDVDDFITDSDCKRYIQPLPFNLVAKSRPLKNKKKFCQKSIWSSTGLNNSKPKCQISTNFWKGGTKSLSSLSPCSQNRSPLVEVHINSSATENSFKSLNNIKNHNTLFLKKSSTNLSRLRKKANSYTKPLKSRPYKTHMKKENVDVSKSLVADKAYFQSLKKGFGSGIKRSMFPLNKTNNISDSANKIPTRLFDPQNKRSLCINTKENECFCHNDLYSSDNNHICALNSSQPLSPILDNIKLSFTTPISGEGIINNKEFFELVSPLRIDTYNYSSNAGFPEKSSNTKSFPLETKESEILREPNVPPISGSMQVNTSGEGPVLEQIDASDYLSPVLDKMHARHSLQTVQQNVLMQKRNTNIICPVRSDQPFWHTNPINNEIKNGSLMKSCFVFQNMKDTSSSPNLEIEERESLFSVNTFEKSTIFEHPEGKMKSDSLPISPVLNSCVYRDHFADPLRNLNTANLYNNNAQQQKSKSSTSCDKSAVSVPHHTSENHKEEIIAGNQNMFKTFPSLFFSSPQIKQQDLLTTPKNTSNNINLMVSPNFQEDSNQHSLPKPKKELLTGLKSVHCVLQDVFLGCSISDEASFDNTLKDSYSTTSLDIEDVIFMTPPFHGIRNFPLLLPQTHGEFIEKSPFKASKCISTIETSSNEDHLILQALEPFTNSTNDSNFSLISKQWSRAGEKKEILCQDNLLYSKNSSDLLKLCQNEILNHESKSNKTFSTQKISQGVDDCKTDKLSEVPKYVQSSPNTSYVNKNSINKTVRKSLSLFYESLDRKQTSVNTFSDFVQNPTSKGTLLTANKEENDGINISGVERLPEQTHRQTDVGKCSDFIREESQTTQSKCKLIAVSEKKTNLSQQLKNSQSLEGSVLKNKINWKNTDEFFETQYKTCIEDFHDDSPNSKNISLSPVSSSKSSLTLSVEQNAISPTVPKSPLCDGRNQLHDLTPCFQNVNMCKDESSEEFSCELDIQDSSQESVRSSVISIECSTSSNTKSTQESESNMCSGGLSFPPALEEAGRKQLCVEDVLDSASKPKKKRLKRDSLVERMRRLVRSEQTDVNMFRHEGAPRSAARACSLLVESIVSTCSKLVLTCRYADAHCAHSEPLSSGEEGMDPDVCVFVDPNYAKHLKSGSRILVYPPWRCVWLDERGVIMMYSVTKLQLISCGNVTNQPKPQQTTSLLSQFHCQYQEDECECQRELMGQLWCDVESSPEHNWASDSIMMALTQGRYPHNIRLRLTTVHRYRYRNSKNQVLTSMLCVDGNGDVCQLNLRSVDDEVKLDKILKNSKSSTLVLHKLTIFKRLTIDRCKGLRSMLSQLHRDSATQQLMYVVTPSSDQWSAQLAASSATLLQSAELLSVFSHQDSEGRLSASVQVMAERRDQLYVWEKQQDAYTKINVTPSAVLPSFSARSSLHINFLWKHEDIFTIDKYSIVTAVEIDVENSPSAVIPRLSLSSVKGDLVLLDSVVVRVNSDVSLRWVGVCGHNLLKLRSTELFYCATCVHTVSTCEQTLALEVCVDVTDVAAPIRVKVKNETGKVLLLGSEGHVSSNKSYNLIGAIGTSLKCMTVVLEVLKNPFGDILEFLLEEL